MIVLFSSATKPRGDLEKVGMLRQSDDIVLPVIRAGIVTSQSSEEGLSVEEAILLGDALKSPSDFFAQYQKQKSEFLGGETSSLSPADERVLEPRIRWQLTPIIAFPAFSVKLAGCRVVARDSITVCVGESKSKLWVSCSVVEKESSQTEVFKWDELDALNETLNDFCNHSVVWLQEFYTRLIESVLPDRVKSGLLPLQQHYSVHIVSLGTRVNIDDTVSRALYTGRRQFLRQLRSETAGINGGSAIIVTDFLEWVSKHSGVVADSIDLKVSTAMPFELERSTSNGEGTLANSPQNPHDQEPRVSLVGCCPLCENGYSETYFSIGYDDPRTSQPKWRNSEICSRAILMEIGRLF